MFEKELQGPAPITTDERFVFEVPSDSNASVKYRVDLEENSGNGWCSCPDFKTRRQPAIDAGAPILADEATCKHVRRCWAFVFIACAQQIGHGSSHDPKPISRQVS